MRDLDHRAVGQMSATGNANQINTVGIGVVFGYGLVDQRREQRDVVLLRDFFLASKAVVPAARAGIRRDHQQPFAFGDLQPNRQRRRRKRLPHHLLGRSARTMQHDHQRALARQAPPGLRQQIAAHALGPRERLDAGVGACRRDGGGSQKSRFQSFAQACQHMLLQMTKMPRYYASSTPRNTRY
nr:hypothetical protein [Duganella sp. HH101]